MIKPVKLPTAVELEVLGVVCGVDVLGFVGMVVLGGVIGLVDGLVVGGVDELVLWLVKSTVDFDVTVSHLVGVSGACGEGSLIVLHSTLCIGAHGSRCQQSKGDKFFHVS